MSAVPASPSSSSFASSVTVCAVLQSVVVKVSVPPVFTLRSESCVPVVLRATVTVTLADGLVASLTVYVAVEPSVTDTLDAEKVKPFASLSDSVAVTVPVTLPYPPPLAVWEMSAVPASPSSSSFASSVTVWAVLQLPVVKVREPPVLTLRSASCVPVVLRATVTVTLAAMSAVPSSPSSGFKGLVGASLTL